MTTPPQGYPQQYSAPPQYSPPPQRGGASPRWTAGLLAVFVFLIAAGAAIWGTFETILSYVRKYPEPVGGANEYRFSMTWWAYDESGPSPHWFPPYGTLVAISGGLIVVAAILAMTAFSGRRAGLVTGVRISAALGIGLLTGVAAIRLLDSLQTLDQVNGGSLQPGESVDFKMGLGVYLPGGAAVLALIGLALTINRGRVGRVEPDTPRMGIPMPYPAQQYQPHVQQPVSQPFPAQQPVSQPVPVQQPVSQPFPVQQPVPAQPEQPTPPPE